MCQPQQLCKAQLYRRKFSAYRCVFGAVCHMKHWMTLYTSTYKNEFSSSSIRWTQKCKSSRSCAPTHSPIGCDMSTHEKTFAICKPYNHFDTSTCSILSKSMMASCFLFVYSLFVCEFVLILFENKLINHQAASHSSY